MNGGLIFQSFFNKFQKFNLQINKLRFHRAFFERFHRSEVALARVQQKDEVLNEGEL